MSDIHALSGAYAVDALDDLERARFEQHLAECGTCRHEVDSLRETAVLMAETKLAEPPAALRARVLAEAARIRPLPPVTAPVAEPTRARRRLLTMVAAAAAAVVLAVGVGAIVVQQLDDDQSRVEQVLAADDAERYTQELPGGATATVVRSKELNGAVLVTEDMPDAPTGQTYALWLQHDETMVPAGIMPAGPDQQTLLEGDAATADGAGITAEVAGTEPESPQGDVIALFEFTET